MLAKRGLWTNRAAPPATTQSTRFAAPRFVLSANPGIIHHPLHPRMQGVDQKEILQGQPDNRRNPLPWFPLQADGDREDNHETESGKCEAGTQEIIQASG